MKTFYVVVGALALAGLSCAVAPDPGEFTVVPRDSGSNVGLGSDGGVIGGDPGVDGGDAGEVKVDPVFGTSSYVLGSGSAPMVASAEASHNFAGSMDPAGQDCIMCHKGGGAAAGKPFLFGGTLYKDAAGTIRQVAGVQVRVINPQGNIIADAYTDKDGNFYVPATGGMTIPTGSKVGVRSSTTQVRDMTTAIGDGTTVSCSSAGSCHKGTAGAVFLP